MYSSQCQLNSSICYSYNLTILRLFRDSSLDWHSSTMAVTMGITFVHHASPMIMKTYQCHLTTHCPFRNISHRPTMAVNSHGVLHNFNILRLFRHSRHHWRGSTMTVSMRRLFRDSSLDWHSSTMAVTMGITFVHHASPMRMKTCQCNLTTHCPFYNSSHRPTMAVISHGILHNFNILRLFRHSRHHCRSSTMIVAMRVNFFHNASPMRMKTCQRHLNSNRPFRNIR